MITNIKKWHERLDQFGWMVHSHGAVGGQTAQLQAREAEIAELRAALEASVERQAYDALAAERDRYKSALEAVQPAAQQGLPKRKAPPRDQALCNVGSEPDWVAYAAAEVQQGDGEWQEAQRVCDLPPVHEVIQGFADDQTGDSATMIVREVMRAIAQRAGSDVATNELRQVLADLAATQRQLIQSQAEIASMALNDCAGSGEAFQRDHEKAVRAIEVAAEFTPALREVMPLSPASAISHLAYLLAQPDSEREAALLAREMRDAQLLASLLRKERERFEFLHSTNKDSEGWEWGVARVRVGSNGGIEYLWGASDHSDVDAAMSAQQGEKASDPNCPFCGLQGQHDASMPHPKAAS